MKIAGIIAEYNPFHNGHAYQIATLKQQTGADYVVVAMSGEFLQRGVPACVDKYARAKMALLSGADLVLQIPTLWSCASAEYFATAGVRLLGETGVVNHIGYGTENAYPELLHKVSAVLSDSPKAYEEKLKNFQKEGLSFPAARAAALSELLPDTSKEEFCDFFSTPNNILAVEYEKALLKHNQTLCTGKDTPALHTSELAIDRPAVEYPISGTPPFAHPITGIPIPRIGDGYHDRKVTSRYASATAIREKLFAGEDITPLLPESTSEILLENFADGLCVQENQISQMLYYVLRRSRKEGYSAFADCSPSLSRRIANHLPDYENFEQFCLLLKTKDLTYTRISRVLVHILLGITNQDYENYRGINCVPYLRILGFRDSAAPLLSAIKKEASVPLVAKVADASRILSSEAYSLFELDLLSADLYNGLRTRNRSLTGNEFTRSPIITPE